MPNNQPTSEGYEAAIQALRTYGQSLEQNAALIRSTDRLLEGNLSYIRAVKGIHGQTTELLDTLTRRIGEIDSLVRQLEARLRELLDY